MRSLLLSSLLALALLAVLPVQAANQAATPPTVDQIKAWAPAEQAALGIKVEELVPVTLIGGEQAYLASVSYDKAARNFWTGYLLVRPSQQQARALEGFGGQYIGITPLDPYLNSQQIVIIGAAGSDQGTIAGNFSVVAFDGWTPKSLHSASTSDNSDHCGTLVGTSCKGNGVYINILNGPLPTGKLGLVVTDVSYSSPDLETTAAKFSHETQVLFIDNPHQ